jgi:hypothetical protein
MQDGKEGKEAVMKKWGLKQDKGVNKKALVRGKGPMQKNQPQIVTTSTSRSTSIRFALSVGSGKTQSYCWTMKLHVQTCHCL